MSNTFNKGRRNGHRGKGWYWREKCHRPLRVAYRRITHQVVMEKIDPEEINYPHPRKPKGYWD